MSIFADNTNESDSQTLGHVMRQKLRSQRIPTLNWMLQQTNSYISMKPKDLGIFHLIPDDKTLKEMHKEFSLLYKELNSQNNQHLQNRFTRIEDTNMKVQILEGIQKHPIAIYSGHNNGIHFYQEALKHLEEKDLSQKLQFQMGCSSLEFQFPYAQNSVYQPVSKSLIKLNQLNCDFMFGLQWPSLSTFLDFYTKRLINNWIVKSINSHLFQESRLKDMSAFDAQTEDSPINQSNSIYSLNLQNYSDFNSKLLHQLWGEYHNHDSFNLYGVNFVSYGLFQRFDTNKRI
eukprot:403359872